MVGAQRLERDAAQPAPQHRLHRLLALLAVQPLQRVLERGRLEAEVFVAALAGGGAGGVEGQVQSDDAAFLLLRQRGGGADLQRLLAGLGDHPRILSAGEGGQLAKRRQPVGRIQPGRTRGQVDAQHRIGKQLAAGKPVPRGIGSKSPHQHQVRGNPCRRQRRLHHQHAVAAALREDVRGAGSELGAGRSPPHRLRDRGVDLPRRLVGRLPRRLPRQLLRGVALPGAEQRPVGHGEDQLLLSGARADLHPGHDFGLARRVRLRLQRRGVADGEAEALPFALARDGVGRQRQVVRVHLEGCGCEDLVGALGERRLVVAEVEGRGREARQLGTTRRDAAQVVDLHRVARLEARQADALLLRNRLGLQHAAVGLQGPQMEDLRVRGDLRLAELDHALLVEDAGDGVDALDPAAVGEELRGAVVEQAHGARSFGDLGARLGQRGGVAVGPGEEPCALVEGELLAELEIARSEAERGLARVGGALGLAQ